MGGVANAIEKPFRTGASSQKKEAQRQQDLMIKQAKEAEDARKRQEQVAQAQAKVMEDTMFEPQEEGLSIEAVDAGGVGGKRKRKRQQDTSGGLGIG